MTTITSIAVAISGILVLGVVFMIARRILRFAFRAALVVALLIAVGIAGLVFWYSGGISSAKHENTTRTTTHRTSGSR